MGVSQTNVKSVPGSIESARREAEEKAIARRAAKKEHARMHSRLRDLTAKRIATSASLFDLSMPGGCRTTVSRRPHCRPCPHCALSH